MSVLLVGILLIVAGFFAYSNFYRSEQNPKNAETLKIESGQSSEGSISGGAIGPQGNVQTTGSIAGAETQTGNKTQIKENTTWQARLIERNSIKESTYTVQKGDTLWEIAKGKYGSGFEWHKILKANKDKVGFLPNGSQALIEVGQELALP